MSMSPESEEYPTATPGPLDNIRENVVYPTDPRGSRGSTDFTMVTSIDNGQVLHPASNTLSPPPFGNGC